LYITYVRANFFFILMISLSFSSNFYVSYDIDDTEIISFGYYQNLNKYENWSLDFGADLDIESDFFKFINIYLQPTLPISNKISLWSSLGYGFIIDDGGFESLNETYLLQQGIAGKVNVTSGFSHGIGLSYDLNDKIGFRLGMISNKINADYKIVVPCCDNYEADIDNLDRTNIYIIYKF